jgi:hypothetical protein
MVAEFILLQWHRHQPDNRNKTDVILEFYNFCFRLISNLNLPRA